MDRKIAVLILTLNEETNIRECIESVAFADEVIIIDSGSTDKTCEIAENLGAKFLYHAMDEGFAGQRNFALTQTLAEWVLFLDADERITPELAVEIKEIVQKNEQFAYNILRRNVVFGEQVSYGGHSPDYSLRLYPREAIHWQGVVHEQAQVNLPILQTKNGMLHYTYTSWDRYFFKFNQYTTLMAEQMKAKGKKARFIDIILHPLAGFFRFYIAKSGWRDGKIGFILAVFHGFYTMAKYVKLYYLQKERKE